MISDWLENVAMQNEICAVPSGEGTELASQAEQSVCHDDRPEAMRHLHDEFGLPPCKAERRWRSGPAWTQLPPAGPTDETSDQDDPERAMRG